MKISVITVSFNSAATIGDTLASVANQTWPDVEHVIIDGASKDDTLDVVRKLGTHVAHVTSERDKGIYDAMNKGVAVSSGDVIAFLNADDFYAHPDVLRHVANALTDTDIDAVFGDVEFFQPDRADKVTRRYSSAFFRPHRVASGWMPAHPSLFVRRSVFETVGPFSTEYRIAGDFEWIARAFHLRNTPYRYMREVFVRMRTGGASTGGWRSTVLLNREVIRALRSNGIRTSWLKVLSKYPLKALEFLRA